MEITDCHGHSSLSYCARDDLTIDVYRRILDDPACQVVRQAITNHSFQAYFPPDLAWSWEFLDAPSLLDEYEERGDARLLGFRNTLRGYHDDRLLFGVEVELMGDGRLSCTEEVRAAADLLLGSLHVLPRSFGARHPLDSFLAYTRGLAAAGVDVIAHPFRWLADMVDTISRDTVRKTVAVAAEFGCALELNVRGRQSALVMLIQEAVGAGVPIAIGTDAHRSCEVGLVEPHLEYIRVAGFDPRAIELYRGRDGSA